MEIREIFDTIESDPCMDKDLQKYLHESAYALIQTVPQTEHVQKRTVPDSRDCRRDRDVPQSE